MPRIANPLLRQGYRGTQLMTFRPFLFLFSHSLQLSFKSETAQLPALQAKAQDNVFTTFETMGHLKLAHLSLRNLNLLKTPFNIWA